MRKGLHFIASIILGMACVQCAYAATASYQLEDNWNDLECNRFLNIVKASPISNMTNQQLCDAITIPVTKLLPASQLTNLDWTKGSTTDLAAVAKNVIEASEPASRRPAYAKNDAIWLQEVTRLAAKHQVRMAYSRVQLQNHTYYVIRLTETVCDAGYGWHGPLPTFGFFLDSDHVHGVPVHPISAGQLVYFSGDLVTFNLFPRWIPNQGTKMYKLSVEIQYITPGRDSSQLYIGKSCLVTIRK